LNRGPESPSLKIFRKRASNLDVFEGFCKIDLQLTESTAKLHVRLIRAFQKEIQKDSVEVTKQDLRNYLMMIKESMAASTYKNILAALKRFYRDYLGMKDLVETFKFPELGFKPIIVPSKTELQVFYKALETHRNKALFLMYATSGLRCSEILSLNRYRDVDFKNRMLKPRKSPNESKHTWLSFYNAEAERELKKYLALRKDSNPKLFPISKKQLLRTFKKAWQISEVKVTPQILRDWFCCEMGNLGVQDRYVDAFCGRMPKSVLARHYTDYSPRKLKQIYDKAKLTVLRRVCESIEW